MRSDGVASLENEAVKALVKSKYPERKKELPSQVFKESPLESLQGLRDSLLSLRRGVAPGAGGLRTEYLKALAQVLEPAQMQLLEKFLLRYLRSDLPAWFTKVWLTVQTVALWKTPEKIAVRPLGIRNPLLKIGHKEVMKASTSEFREFFEPQQLGLSEGGAAKLVHSFRMYMELNEQDVLVKGDLKNGFNEEMRAAIVQGLEEEPSLQHLTWFAATTLAPAHGLESRGKLWGWAAEGETQGDPKAGAFFCAGWHKFLRQLDATVAAGGGFARAGWDDVYVAGPPDVVFPALDIFWRQLEEFCGLVCQRDKSAVYTRTGQVPAAKPADLPMAGKVVGGVWVPGLILYRVPIGDDRYVLETLQEKVREVAEGAVQACKVLATEKQSLWTLLRASVKFQFEYWLSLVYPSLVRPAARAMDRVLWEMLEKVCGQHIPREEEGLGWQETLTGIPVEGLEGRSLQKWLVETPVRLGGLGIGSQEDLAPIAFLGSLLQAVPFFKGEHGVCSALGHLVGKPGDKQWEPLLQSGCRTGEELRSLWQLLQREAYEAAEFLGKEVEGPLSGQADGAGAGMDSKELRSTLSRGREQQRRDVFERALTLQSRRKKKGAGISSIKERDKLSTAFLLSLPGPRYGLSSPVFVEALATLLAMPSLVCRDRVGEKVGRSRVDSFGLKIINANVPGGHWTTRHNAIEHELASLCTYAGVPVECEPYGIFGHLLPQQALHRLQRGQYQVLRPDLRLEVAPTSIKVTPRRVLGEAAPAPVSRQFSGSMIAEVKVIGKGVKNFYKTGTASKRAVDTRAEGIQSKYEEKAEAMDQVLRSRRGRGAMPQEAEGVPPCSGPFLWGIRRRISRGAYSGGNNRCQKSLCIAW